MDESILVGVFRGSEANQNCNIFMPRPPRRTSKQQEKPSARKREHSAL
jgi:hypothetical protein